MPDDGLPERAAAAARLLLAPPDPALLAALAPLAEAPLDAERARQDFYDFLCVPQSGCYIPPYAHVLARGEWNGEDLALSATALRWRRRLAALV